MNGEITDSINRLSEFLPPDVRRDIFRVLTEKYDNERILAKEIGCSPSSVRKWKKNGSFISNEYMPRILVLSLKRDPDTKDLLRTVGDELNHLCSNLVSEDGEESNLSRFMESVDEKSREIVWYFLRNRHAGIRELSDLIHAPTDMDVLTRVKEVINPKARSIFGKPILQFKESRINPLTGNKILFSWWLEEDISLQEENDILDVFDERDYLVVITELPGVEEKDIKVEVKDDILLISAGKYHKRTPLFYVVKDIEKTYNNGILELKLKKEVI